MRQMFLTLFLLLLRLFAAQAQQLPPLREAFAPHFLIGTAIDYADHFDRDTVLSAFIRREFSAIVAANQMKADHLQPHQGEYRFEDGDRLVRLARENGQTLTGHCLVWHSQCPRWMFTDSLGQTVSRTELIRRMRDHIQTVVRHYSGQVKGWDVVNEAIEGDGRLRRTPYLDIIGPEYLRLAFQFAHEADPQAELYYNDYGMDSPAKREAVCRLVRELRSEGLRIDAVGMQSHLSLWTNLAEYEKSMEAFIREGVKVMATELDVSVLPWPGDEQGADVATHFDYQERLNPYRNGLPPEVERELGDFYCRLFQIFMRHRRDITRVTFWGTHDGVSWLNNFPIHGRTNYPLPFDRSLQPKPFVRRLVEMAESEP